MQARILSDMRNVGVGIMVLTAIAVGGTGDQAQTNQTATLPLSKVAEYFNAHDKNTTIKNNQIGKALIGRTFTGTVVVTDVMGDDQQITLVSGLPDCYAEFYFDIKDALTIKKAADIDKGVQISLSARLAHLAATNIAFFGEVKALTILPTTQEPAKK